MHKSLFAISASTVITAFASISLAEPAPAEAPAATPAATPPAAAASAEAPAPVAAKPTGDRVHDGFYLRLTAGYGMMPIKRTTTPESGETKISGNGAEFDLSIGGSPIRGLAIAGTVLAHVVSSPTVKAGNIEAKASDAVFMTYFGPTVDGYPDPTGGFHVGGGIGYGTVSAVNYDATGLALQAFTGYDFWIGKSWSVGPLLRALWVNGKKDIGAGASINDSGTSITLGISFTDH